MRVALKVLLLEENRADAELLAYELGHSHYDIDLHRVETEEAYRAGLDWAPDLILADFSLPGFDAMQALSILDERGEDIPLIVVTDTVSEDVVVECMRRGAADYLIKDRLGRLIPAIEQALEKKRLRDEQRQVIEALKISEDKFSKAFHLSPDAITINRLYDGVYLEINSGFEFLSGYKAKDVLGRTTQEMGVWKSKASLRRFLDKLRRQGEVRNMEAVFIGRGGYEIFGLISARVLRLNGERCVLSITRDITERVMASRALEQAHQELESAYDATIAGWSKALELRDQETQGHTQRVTTLSLRLGRRLGFSESELKQLHRGVLLHDIGKMAVPDEILRKPAPLTPEEWEIMRQHPLYAYRMLSSIAYLRSALVVPYYHHERWDGSGYPEGLKGEEIPLMARLFAIVDVWDSLCNDRVYRKRLPAKEVVAYLRENAGKLFDPYLVDVFLDMLNDDFQAGYEPC